MYKQLILLIAITLGLSSCATTAPKQSKKISMQDKARPLRPPIAPGPQPVQQNSYKASSPATMRPYTVFGKTYYPTVVQVGQKYTGIASWYGPTFHGKKTSNGEIFDTNAFTAAHKTLPMNTIVHVRNRENGRSTTVRINDRGPFVGDRIIDLSNAAAKKIDMLKKGTASVEVTVLAFDNHLYLAKEKREITQAMMKGLAKEPKSYVGGNFMLQIGAFSQKAGAISLANKHPKSKVQQGLDGLWRVFLHGFGSEDEAKDRAGDFAGSFIYRE